MGGSDIRFKPGDFIGLNYQVYGVLGRGGFGIVYKVYHRETKSVYALKTFRDVYFGDKEARELFVKEANVLVNLERFAYLVRAFFVDEVDGRLYIAMEYIAPADNQGLNSLEGYIKWQPPDSHPESQMGPMKPGEFGSLLIAKE